MATLTQSPKIKRIEDSSAPLAYKVCASQSDLNPTASTQPEKIIIRTKVRSLSGMQKEALVTQKEPAGSTWRMVCDEGPYLNGTDLAPFPLAFYTAGLQFNYLSEILNNARTRKVDINALQLFQDNYYSMQGSFLKGDAKGGAQPAEVLVKIESEAPTDVIKDLIQTSEVSSPAHAAMRDVLANTFALTFNGSDLEVKGVLQSQVTGIEDPMAAFDNLQPTPDSKFLPDAITKVASAEKIRNVEGGIASSLQPVQKRQLHVHGEAGPTAENSVKRTTVWLHKPIGSTFGFASDDEISAGGRDLAPSGLLLLSAGIGFCYMTQISRYAHIANLKLASVRIVQDTVFSLHGSREVGSLSATAHPVDTHVFIEADESKESAQKIVSMGAQTCFLHAALSDSYQTRIQARLNGRNLK